MALLVSVALFGLLATVITAYGYGRYAKPARLLQQLDPEPAATVTFDRIGQPKPSLLARRVEAIGQHAPISPADAQTTRRTLMAAGYRAESAVALYIGRLHGGRPIEPSLLARRVEAIGQHAPISPADAQTTRRTLMAAGYRAESAVALLYGIKLILAVTLAILSIVFRDSITANPVLRIVLPVAATVAGYWIPGFLLERKVSKRQEKLRLSLPDGLDLMVVSVEAGLGLERAIQNVGRELAVAHPELSDELSLVTLEMRAGKRRAEALRNLAQRSEEGRVG